MKKKFGQNFIKNPNIIEKIISASQINNESVVYEVGPGDGSLTREILKKNPKQFLAVEIDQTFKNTLINLCNKKNYQIFFDDAVNFNEKKFLKKKVVIISNLPYNISLKLLIKWIYQIKDEVWYSSMILMFQKEVAERIIAKNNTKKFGRITILVSAFFEVEKILDVDKNNFFPIPQVDSSVLKFKVLKHPRFDIKNIDKLENLTKNLFSNKRKKLRNKINFLFKKEVIKKNKFDNYYDLRAENLDLETIFLMAKLL